MMITDEVRFLAPDNFKTKNMISRKIKLKRKEIVRFGLPKELKEEKICNLGSYADSSGNTARAFSYEEEDKWMSEIVGLKVTDPGFRSAVTHWYKNLTIKIKPEGVDLEIGLDSAGNPVNIEDYLKYQFAKKHPWTAKTKEECLGAEHLQYYFEDPEAENISKGAKLEVTAKAYVEFAKLDEDEDKMDWLIRTVISKFPELGSLSELTKLNVDRKKLKIAEVIQKDPTYFLEVMNDKDLIYKAEVASMVEAGVLMKEGNKYLNGTENLGSLEGTISWMKDGNNSQDYAILKARLDQFGTPITSKTGKSKKETK
jgi:hypothetical protein